MQEENVALKWGDVVRIHGVNISKKKTTKGLIMSKGFTDPNMYYQIYQNFEEVNFYRESLFQILPKSNFDMHDQLKDESIGQQQREALKPRAEGQINQFETNLEAKSGNIIKYGSEVVFRHVESKGYLEGMLKAADSGEGAFRVEVSDNLSSFVVFKIISHRSYQNENDTVFYNDALQIYHMGSDSFINFDENEEPILLDKPQQSIQVPEDHPFSKLAKNRPSIKRPLDKRISIINENKSKCLWKFIQHCTHAGFLNKQKIKSHDIVYFEHTKIGEESLISSNITNSEECYLKESAQGQSYQCFWELIPKQVNQFGPQEPDAFWARNIVTGCLLTYNGFNVQIQQDGESSGNGFDNRGLINLICSEATQQEDALKLERGPDLQIEERVEEIIRHYEDNFKKVSLDAVQKLPKDIFKIYKVQQTIMFDAEYILTSHEPLVKFVESLILKLMNKENFNYFDFFMSFDMAALENIINILKLLTGKIYGTDYDNIEKSGNTQNKNVQKILVETGITQILIEIISLLYEPYKEIIEHPEPSDDRPIRLKMMEIFQISYNLIGNVATGYELNRIYISRWIDLFLEHSNNINKSFIQQCILGILQNNPLSIQATINEYKIESLITNFFNEAENSTQELTTKYLRLFSTFIRCDSTVIKNNQNIILNKFFKNPKNHFNFRFKVDYRNQIDEENDPFRVKSKEVLISFNHEAFIKLPQFFDEQSKKWNFFLKYIDLLADICMDRNNEAIQFVTGILPLQCVAVILNDCEVHQLKQRIKEENQEEIKYPVINIHEPFIRIAHHAYVDNEKFQQIKRIKKISRWYRYEENDGEIIEDINRTKRVFEGEKEEEQQRYLKSVLEYIKEYLKTCTQKPTDLNTLLTVLNLLKATVILGLWTTIKSFREIVPLLIRRIAKIEDDTFFTIDPPDLIKRKTGPEILHMNKEGLSMNRPEIARVIQCKIKATQIYSYMNEFQIDIRLRYLMNFFKGLYETTEDFNSYDYPERELTLIEENLEEEEKEQLEEAKKRNEKAKQQYNKKQENQLLGREVQKVTKDIDIMLKETIWYNKLKEMTPFSYEKTEDPMKDRYFFQRQPDNEEDEPDHNEDFKLILLSLFELPIYKNYRLLNSSLKMLRGMFEQRKDLLENFKKILICGKGNLQEVYLTLKFMRAKFIMLTNSSIVNYQGESDKSFTYDIWKPYDYLVKDKQKRSGIIQDLFFLARTLKDETSLRNIESLMDVDPEVFQPNQIYTFFSEKQKNNKLFQSLNLAEGIYIPLIEFIKIMNKEKVFSEIHRKLLIAVYQYLTILCFENLQAKQMLMHYIPDILPHLGKKVGADSFLFMVCKSNKLLVSNEVVVTNIIDAALKSCVDLETGQALGAIGAPFLSLNQGEQLQSNDYEKSRILYSLRSIILFNQQGHKRNQQILMNRLQDNRYKRLIYNQLFKPSDKNHKLNDFSLTPIESYIAYHFELLSVLVQSSNLINIGKLSNIHNYPNCLSNLENTNRWEIRRALRAYINRLYYVNTDKDIFLFEEFIRREFDIMNKELGDLVQLHKSRLLTADLKIKNGIRFQYAQSQIYLVIFQILITLHEMFLKPDFLILLRNEIKKEEKITDGVRHLHEKLITLFKNLGCLKKLYPETKRTKTITCFIEQIKRLLMIQLENLQLRFLQKKSEPEGDATGKTIEEEEKEVPEQTKKNSYTYDHSRSFFRNLHQMLKFLGAKQKIEKAKQEYQNEKNQVNIPETQMKKTYLKMIFDVPGQKLKEMYQKKEPLKEVHYNPHLQTSNSRIFKVLSKPECEENQENDKLNDNLRKLKNQLDKQPIFSKFKDDEFINLVNIFTELNDTSAEYYKTQWLESLNQKKSLPVISTNQFFQFSFKMIMDHKDDIQDGQKIFVIKLARCYITQAVENKQDYKLLVDKWDPDYCSGLKELDNRQETIEKCGGSDFLISIFQDNLTGRIQLLNQALLLGIAYLYGGNSICQNSILASLRRDPDNIMLIQIKNMIKSIGDFLINIRKFKQHEKKRQYNHSLPDTFDYFNNDFMLTRYFGQNQADDKYENMIEDENQKALCRMFRFLQLFCENNNIEMKKFLSIQTNDDDSKKTNSINFIEEATGLLRKFFKVMNIKMVNIPNNLLAFIVEITQLPCIDNQIVFIQSTFFEDLSYLAAFFDSEDNQKSRKLGDDSLCILNEMYIQGIQLALSNFEGNQKILLSEFMKKCQPKFLWLVIRSCLWDMIKNRHNDKIVDIKTENTEVTDHALMINTLKNLTKQNLEDIIKKEKIKENRASEDEEQKEDFLFKKEIVAMINVLAIFGQIFEYGEHEKELAFRDKENINMENYREANRALDFELKFSEYAETELPAIEDLKVLLNNLIFKIEVQCFNGREVKKQKIYFPRHPVFDYLAKSTKNNIMCNVSRQTQRDKLITLLDEKENVYDEIKEYYSLNYYQLNVFGRKEEFSITSDRCDNIKKTANYLSYLICILLGWTINIDHDFESQQSYFHFKSLFWSYILIILCFVQLVITLIYCVLWYKMRAKLSLKKYKQQMQQEDEEEEQPPSMSGVKLLSLQFFETFGAFIKYYIFKGISKIMKKFHETNIYNQIVLPIVALWQIDPETKSLLIYVCGSLLGNFYGYQWYTLHIFDFFLNIPMLANVFKSVIGSIDVLSLMCLLAVAFTVVFNLLSLSTYTHVIYEEEMPEQSCTSVYSCVLQFYTAGPVGGDFNEGFEPQRFTFDTIYVLFMELIFQGIISGIIIDDYDGLIQKDETQKQDETGVCYICGKIKSNIQRDGETFKKHTYKHELWYYLFYIYCLQNKDETDYTGIEYTISEQIDKKQLKWFPLQEGDEGGDISGVAEQLELKLDQMKQKSLEIVQKNTQIIGECSKSFKKKRLELTAK